jgi:hypothetical protein
LYWMKEAQPPIDSSTCCPFKQLQQSTNDWHHSLTRTKRNTPARQPLSLCTPFSPPFLPTSIRSCSLSDFTSSARRTSAYISARRMLSGTDLASSLSAFHCVRLSRLGTVRCSEECETWCRGAVSLNVEDSSGSY